MILSTINIPIVASMVAFITMLLLFVGMAQILKQSARRRELADKINQGEKLGSFVAEESSLIPGSTSKQNRFISMIGELGKQAKPESLPEYTKIRLGFIRAGIRSYNAPSVFWGTKIILALALPFLFSIGKVALIKLLTPASAIAIAVLFGLVGFYLPNLWLRLKIGNRKSKVLEGLPDALDLLVVCVEAGMGLDAAINRVADEIKLTNPTLSEELKLVNLEVRAGKTREDALKNLALRTNLEDVISLVTLMIQTDRFGTSIAQTLRVYSDAFRTKRYQRAEEIAAKLPVKILFPCIMFIFPSLFVVILGPAAIRIYQVLLKH